MTRIDLAITRCGCFTPAILPAAFHYRVDKGLLFSADSVCRRHAFPIAESGSIGDYLTSARLRRFNLKALTLTCQSDDACRGYRSMIANAHWLETKNNEKVDIFIRMLRVLTPMAGRL
jgi:hypothetical protein